MFFVRNLIDLAMPQSCAGCGTSGIEICPRCVLALTGSAHRVDVRGIGRGEFPIAAAAFYEGSVRDILLAVKERGQVTLIPFVARAALIAATSLLGDVPSSAPLSLIPVPSRAKNLRWRGYNLVAQTTDLVARHLRMRFDDVQVISILRYSRQVSDQSRLTAKQRTINLCGAFTAIGDGLPDLKTREVIIVDDLVTTGSTLLEARRALLQSGANLRGAACAVSSR